MLKGAPLFGLRGGVRVLFLGLFRLFSGESLMPEQSSDNAPANVLEVKDLAVSFFAEEGVVKAVSGVSFEIKRGKCLAIVGESGSGKSVNAYSIMRLIQSPGKIMRGSVTIRPKDEPALDVVKLHEKDERLYHVRGGLVGMIFQEPMTALDVTIQAQILTLIKDLQAEMGTSVLFITHDIGVVAQVADEVCVMYQGRIVERGGVRPVLKNPLHPYTKGLLGAIPGLASLGKRLPTIETVLAGRDISQPLPLLPAPDGRLVALTEEEIRQIAV